MTSFRSRTTATEAPPIPPRGALARLLVLVERRSILFIGVPAVMLLLAGGVVGYLKHLGGNAPPELSFADAAPEAPDTQDRQDAVAQADPGEGPAGDVAAPDATALPTEDAAAPTSAPTADPGATTAPTDPPTGGAPPPDGQLDGTWAVVSGSVAGYRVDYTAVGVRGTRVGRGEAVTGEFALEDTTIRTASFRVDFREVKCDAGNECDQHVQEIMDVENHPYEYFTLTSPIELGDLPDDGVSVRRVAQGELTLRGVTRSEDVNVEARRNGNRIEVLGSHVIKRADYKIPDAEQPGFSIDEEGTIEFLLVFERR